VASFIIALSVFVSLYFTNSNATIITLLSFILLLGFISILTLMSQPACNDEVVKQA